MTPQEDEPMTKATVIVPCVPTPQMVREGARALDAWSDDAFREEIDAADMAHRIWKAMTSSA